MPTDTEWLSHLTIDHDWSNLAFEHFRENWQKMHRKEHNDTVRKLSCEGRPHTHPTGQLSPIELEGGGDRLSTCPNFRS